MPIPPRRRQRPDRPGEPIRPRRAGEKPLEGPPVYPRSKSGRQLPLLMSVGSLLLLMFAAVSFLVQLFVIPDLGVVAMTMTVTMPATMGLLAGIGAWTLFNAPREVRLTKAGIEVDRSQTRTIPWGEIDHAAIGAATEGYRVKLYDERAKVIETIAGLDRQEELAGRIRAVLDHRDAAAAPGGSTELTPALRKRARLQGVGLIAFGLLLGAAAIFLAIDAAWKSHCRERLRTAAVQDFGRVAEKVVAPNGTTKRLYVDVTDAAGRTHQHNFRVTEKAYDEAVPGEPVAIRTDPDDARIAELAAGQWVSTGVENSPVVAVLLPVCGGLIATVMLAAGVLFWTGRELTVRDGRPRIVPFGQGGGA